MTTIAEIEASPDTMAVRVLPDGRVLHARWKLFGAYDLCITQPEDLPLGIISDSWEYSVKLCDGDNLLCAQLLARDFHHWDGEGEPIGWTRHQPTGRRRPLGKADREVVRP